MIREYAVDPEVLATYSDFQVWYERFGLERGRVIARYPKKWTRAVRDRLQVQGIKRKAVIERLDKLEKCGKLLDLGRKPYDGNKTWLENAVEQNVIREFDAIIAQENPKFLGGVLFSEAFDEDEPRFTAVTSSRVPRRADHLAEAVAPLLHAARKVAFVDPYFHPSESRFANPLRAFLEQAVRGKPLRAVEYHLNRDTRDSPPTEDFLRACKATLPDVLPGGVEMTLYRWRERQAGESLHARYILTDLCGISIEHGLDEETEHQTTDVKLVTGDVYHARREQYKGDSVAFDLVDETTIVGRE